MVTSTQNPPILDRRTGLRSLTPAIADALVEAVSTGLPISTACAKLGLHESTYHEWMNVARGAQDEWERGNPVSETARTQINELSGRIATAKAAYEAHCIALLNEAAEARDKFGRPDWRAATWVLEHAPGYRERYGDKQPAQQTNINVEQAVIAIDPAVARAIWEARKNALPSPEGPSDPSLPA